jgi:Ca2+-binding EF-hand superfamily protein
MEEDFMACFHEFDKDDNGIITKEEMYVFIKMVAGIPN